MKKLLHRVASIAPFGAEIYALLYSLQCGDRLPIRIILEFLVQIPSRALADQDQAHLVSAKV
jgi:hypothetical protein